jgi:hypothetical protein
LLGRKNSKTRKENRKLDALAGLGLNGANKSAAAQIVRRRFAKPVDQVGFSVFNQFYSTTAQL